MTGSRFPIGSARRPPISFTEAVTAIATVPGAWCPSLSPDGDQVAYISDRSGVPRVEIADLSTDLVAPASDTARLSADTAALLTDAEALLTDTAELTSPRTVSGPDQEAISVAWSPDGRWLTYLVSPSGSIRAELHVVSVDGGAPRRLAGGGEFETVFAGCWTTKPDRYAFSMADGRGPGAQVWFVDVQTGRLDLVPASADIGFATVTSVSPNGELVLARCGPRNQRRLMLLKANAVQAPIPLLHNDFPDGGDIGEDGRFAPDGCSVYLRTGAGRDRTVLGQVRLDGNGRPGPMAVIAERPGVDLESYAVAGDGRIILVWNVEGTSAAQIRDLTSDSVQSIPLPQPVMPGWSLHRNGRSMIVEVTGPTAPRTLALVTVPPRGTADQPLGAMTGPRPVPGMPVADLPDTVVEPSLHHYCSADGLELAGWLYRPRNAHGPSPTVVSLHGGPESQERPAFSLLTQSLVAAGLTVFAPNVRGSSGYGNAFMAADDAAARVDSFQDVLATVGYLVDSGFALPDSIGVQGWSYGGYLALTALARWPDLFAAGTTHAGMSDLLSFFAETERWMAAASVPEYGDPVLAADLLRALSPLTHLSQVRSPTLLVHGDRDTNVPVGESIRAHAALKTAGVPTELLLLPGEGHTVVGADHRAQLALAICGWFDRWLVRP